MPPTSQYGVLHTLTKELYEALQRQGIQCRLLIAERENPKPFLESIFSDPPDCTLSFNGLLPDKNGNFFCDMIKIPHVCVLVDSPNHFAALAKSPFNIITCPDLFGCEFFKGLGSEAIIFMPHGVDKNLKQGGEKIYDVVMLSSCIDYEAIEKNWQSKYSKDFCDILKKAADEALTNPTISYVQALVEKINQSGEMISSYQINMVELLDELERYFRGKDRVDLIRNIKSAKIDLFGAKDGVIGWDNYLGDQANVTLHDPIPYEEALDVMKKSKIVLNSSPWIRNGGHERLFASIMCEALAVTNENLYIQDHFEVGKELLFYHPGDWEDLNEKIEFFLTHDEERKAACQKAREKVLKEHTWDERVSKLLLLIDECL